MLEMLLDPRRARRRPWEMVFVGMFYAGLSILLANWLFSGNPVFSKHISILTITFTVMFTIPFFYFLIRTEEKKDGEKGFLIKEHGKAISALMWLFIGFVIAYSLAYMMFPASVGETFQAQIEQYCSINMPSNVDGCVSKYADVVTGKFGLSGAITLKEHAMNILINNIYVLIFSIIFSLLFGAGAIFILAWNASVIAAAIGIFSQASLSKLPVALSRYMIHGLPEIGAYFIAALAGGIIGVALIRYNIKSHKFWDTLSDSINLILLAVILLIIGALIEVFITPRLF